MAHQIETHGTRAAALFARTDPWHRLGTTVAGAAFTAEDAMTLGHLGGWNVRKAPVTATEIHDDGVTSLEVPGAFAALSPQPKPPNSARSIQNSAPKPRRTKKPSAS